MLHKIGMLVVLLMMSAGVSAQDVTVHSDPRLSILMHKKQSVAKATRSKPAARTIPAGDVPQPVAGTPRPIALAGTPSARPVAETSRATGPYHPTDVPVPVVYNSTPRKEGRVIYSGKGFRVQIYNGTDRDKAVIIKNEFSRRYPGTRTYLTYISPSFRVKVGNYRNRSDAEGMLREANSMYNPSMIVPDLITISTY